MGSVIFKDAKVTSYPMRLQPFDKNELALVTGIEPRPTGSNAFGFYPNLDIQGIEVGYLYYTQKGVWHKQVVSFEDPGREDETFFCEDLRDEGESRRLGGHYCVYPIKGSRIFAPIADCMTPVPWEKLENVTEPSFEDAPYVILDDSWRRLWYGLKFHTYLQYSEGPVFGQGIRPIIKFDWALHAIVNRVGGKWELEPSPWHIDPEELLSRAELSESGSAAFIPNMADIKDEYAAFRWRIDQDGSQLTKS